MDHPFENIVIGNIHIHVFNYRLLLYLNTSTLIAIDLFIDLFIYLFIYTCINYKVEKKKGKKKHKILC